MDLLGWVSLAATLEGANILLCYYIQHMYNSGRLLVDGVHTLLALQHLYPYLGGNLHSAWGSLDS